MSKPDCDWKTLKRKEIPDDIKLKKDCIKVEIGLKQVLNVQLFYREAYPLAEAKRSCLTVLLLHGKMFSSKTWLDLETIQLFAAMGFHTVAIDLPGFANTPLTEIEDKVDFVHQICQIFCPVRAIVVSPSMSGWYTLPYLVQKSQFLAGYVPIAPVGFEVLEELPSCEDKSIISNVYQPLQEFLYDPVPDLSKILTPTMVVFGEKDRSRSSALLSLLPNSHCQEIPNGSHPCYIDNPKLFHKLMYNFLSALGEQYAGYCGKNG